jgi:hypothetical protein
LHEEVKLDDRVITLEFGASLAELTNARDALANGLVTINKWKAHEYVKNQAALSKEVDKFEEKFTIIIDCLPRITEVANEKKNESTLEATRTRNRRGKIANPLKLKGCPLPLAQCIAHFLEQRGASNRMLSFKSIVREDGASASGGSAERMDAQDFSKPFTLVDDDGETQCHKACRELYTSMKFAAAKKQTSAVDWLDRESKQVCVTTLPKHEFVFGADGKDPFGPIVHTKSNFHTQNSWAFSVDFENLPIGGFSVHHLLLWPDLGAHY